MTDEAKKENLSQGSLLLEYFQNNPNRDIPHPEVVDWVVKEWFSRTGKIFRDPDRGIRKFAQQGYLQKIRKGVYRYDPNHMLHRELEDFPANIKAAIFERDGYKCVMCGKGRADGVDIHADHIKPKDFGGQGTMENGQTLCAPHNYLKKNLKQTETGKKMFIRLYELAKNSEDQGIIDFCSDILSVFQKYDMNGHIEWKK